MPYILALSFCYKFSPFFSWIFPSELISKVFRLSGVAIPAFDQIGFLTHCV